MRDSPARHRLPPSAVIGAALGAAIALAACSEGQDDSDDDSVSRPLPDAGASGATSVVTDFAPPPEMAPEPPSVDPEATRFFFSYDESASTAARDLTFADLDEGRRPPAAYGRPYEFLNAETFATFDSRTVGDFDVSMTLRRADPGDVPLAVSVNGTPYALGVNLAGPTLPLADRRNVVLTVLVDVSGSMDSAYAAETRSDVTSLLDVAKYGLTRIGGSLKAGDVLNLVTFSTSANVLLEGSETGDGGFEEVVRGLVTEGSTDIGRGVDLAYEVANRTYEPDKANRVIVLTDAFVNTGELDPERIADATVMGGREGILLSGIGVGASFDDAVLNVVTEAGKGTYSAMITPNDAERLFTSGFARFVAPAATDVRFSLSYPQELDQLRSFAEEASTVAEEVRTVNFSYDSSQFFLELFEGPDTLDPDATMVLGIDYTDPAGERRELSLSRTLGELLANDTDELDAAFAVTTLAELVAGRVDCDTVRSSALYDAGVQNETYALYRTNIERYCAL